MIPRNLIIGVIAMLSIAVGMAFYAWHVRTHEVRAVPVEAVAPIAPPVSGPTEPVTLYVAYDNPGVLHPQSFNIPLPQGRQQRAEEVLRAITALYVEKTSPHQIGAASEVRSVYLVEPGMAVIDLNDAFAEGHPSGVLVEELTVASLIETLAANVPGILRVKILVDGKDRETLAGHADLTSFYDVGSVGELVKQLQAGQ